MQKVSFTPQFLPPGEKVWALLCYTIKILQKPSTEPESNMYGVIM